MRPTELSVPDQVDVIVLKRRPEADAPEALASVFERGSPHIGRRAARITNG